MKTTLASAALLSVLTAGPSLGQSPAVVGPAASLVPDSATGEGGMGAGSRKLASALGTDSRFLSGDRQSLLVAVGEGGEGGEGGRGRKRRGWGAPRFDRGFDPYQARPIYRGSRFYEDPYGRSYRGYGERACRVIARRVWDPDYGWITRRERICY